MRVVVLGTGTNVGKTFVTCRLAEALLELGGPGRVLALKPVESGVTEGDLGDAGLIAVAAGHSPRLSPWRLSRPVSPHLAARSQGLRIELARVRDWVSDQESSSPLPSDRTAALSPPRVTLVETAGGVLSPLSELATNLDLALALEPALWLLVAHDSLGVLHDVSATLRALPRPPDAVVLSSARAADASSGTNAAELRRLGIADVLQEFRADRQAAAGLAQWVLARHQKPVIRA